MEKKKIQIEGKKIGYRKVEKSEFFNMTDIARHFYDGVPNEALRGWAKKKDTLLFLEEYEKCFNSDFKAGQMTRFKLEQLENRKKMNFSKFQEITGGEHLFVEKGRYGGVWGCFEYALDFMSWISSPFKVWFMRDYKRMKKEQMLQELRGDKFYAQKNVDNLIESLRYEQDRLDLLEEKEKLLGKNLNEK